MSYEYTEIVMTRSRDLIFENKYQKMKGHWLHENNGN